MEGKAQLKEFHPKRRERKVLQGNAGLLLKGNLNSKLKRRRANHLQKVERNKKEKIKVDPLQRN